MLILLCFASYLGGKVRKETKEHIIRKDENVWFALEILCISATNTYCTAKCVNKHHTSFCLCTAKASSSSIRSLATDNSWSFSEFICWTKLEMHLKGELEPLILVETFSILSDVDTWFSKFDESVLNSWTIASKSLYWYHIRRKD